MIVVSAFCCSCSTIIVHAFRYTTFRACHQCFVTLPVSYFSQYVMCLYIYLVTACRVFLFMFDTLIQHVQMSLILPVNSSPLQTRTFCVIDYTSSSNSHPCAGMCPITECHIDISTCTPYVVNKTQTVFFP